MSKNRVDIHTHLVPPFWTEALKAHGGDRSGWGSPEWSPQCLLEFMDAEEIAVSVLSLTAPGIEGWQGADRVKIAREINDYGASLVNDQPSRLGYLATLALPDVEASLTEICRAFDELGADGIVIHSNFDGTYPGDPLFEPVWEELNRRSAVVFVHPTTLPGVKVLKGQPSPFEDYPADTTKCAVDLVTAGVVKKFSSTKIVLSHGGGFLPYAATRFAELMHSLSPNRSVDSLLTEMNSFYFDTALIAPSGMPSLLAFAAPEHILFGTDYPYASEKVCKTFTENLDSYAQLSTGDLAAINNGARALFPRLKS
jgi:6-methylsalicylate decarboxylase